ncbi:MAG: Beta-lactamase domain protein [Cenarchaeum symbiont of Oopsacas minuta]|nr:Beta-lactamase domain protein [Cenarchaeum symbiont of Oopsacas minuta]
MDVKVLGAAGQVGRSGFLADCDGTRILLDYGVLFGKRGRDPTPPQYPDHVRPRDVDSIVLTHAHLDHSGYIPSMYVSGGSPLYATAPTMELSQILLEDMIKIDKNAHPFGQTEIDNMMRHTKYLQYKDKVRRGDATIELRESGHVIGGSTVLVESNKKRLFYTGDIHVGGSRMLREADLDIGEIDLLITESTYSQKNQTPRVESESKLIEFVHEVMDRKGILFIPSFSVERSQEIACILENAGIDERVIMDGMALKVNDVMFEHPEFLRDYDAFAKAINHATEIRSHRDRIKALVGPCIVISPAGMLVGGNAVFYLQEIAFDERNGIALVSYQGEGTPGKMLLDTGKVNTRGKELHVRAKVKQFQFSGHSDRKELFDMIERIQGDPKVLTVHGDSQSCQMFAEQIKEKFGFDAHAAEPGEIVSV